MLQKKIKKNKNNIFFLTIAASDSSGCAGIQQDLKMAYDNGYWGLNVVTAVTSQSFNKAENIEIIKEKTFKNQLEIIFNSFKISCIKIGIIPKKSFATILKKYLKQINCPIVYDPVYKTSSGLLLIKDNPKDIFNILYPNVTVVTPNIPEYEFYFNDMNISYKLQDTSYKCSGGACHRPFLDTSYNCSGGVHLRPFQIKNYRRGNPCGYPFLCDNHNPFSSIASEENLPHINPAIYIKGGHGEEDSIKEYLIKNDKITNFEYEKKDWAFTRGTGCAFSSLLSMSLVDNDIITASQLARKYLVEYYDKVNKKPPSPTWQAKGEK